MTAPWEGDGRGLYLVLVPVEDDDDGTDAAVLNLPPDGHFQEGS